jgi:hypothetical protein
MKRQMIAPDHVKQLENRFSLFHRVADEIIKSVQTISPVDPVSYRVNDREVDKTKLQMNGNNTIFYIGNVSSGTIRQKVNKVLGRKVDEYIYTPEILEAILTEILHYRVEGQSIALVLFGTMKEMFYKKGDLQGSLSFEQTKEFIYKILEQKFHMPRDILLIHGIEEDPLNQRLFAALQNKKNRDEQGEIDMGKVFLANPSVSLNNKSDSYDIACLLYAAMKNNFQFDAMIASVVPDKKNQPEEIVEKLKYCCMTEVAIRLIAILHGKYIHGGSKLQMNTHSIIHKILSGKSIIKIHVPDLATLFKGKSIESVCVDEKQNLPTLRMEQLIARTRCAIGIVLMGIILFSSQYGYSEYLQYRRNQSQIAAINKLIDDFQYQGGINKEGKFSFDVQQINKAVNTMRMLLSLQYKMTNNDLNKLFGSELDFLRMHKCFIPELSHNTILADDIVNYFVRDHRTIIFEETDINILLPSPNEKRFAVAYAVRDVIQWSKGSISINGSIIDNISLPIPTEKYQINKSKNVAVQYLGDLFEREPKTGYKIYIMRVNQQSYLLASKTNVDESPNSLIAHEAAKLYFDKITNYKLSYNNQF